MKITDIPIVIGALGTIPKGLVSGLDDLKIRRQVETIQIAAWKDRSKYWEESWRLEVTYCHSISREKLSTNAGVKS